MVIALEGYYNICASPSYFEHFSTGRGYRKVKFSLFTHLQSVKTMGSKKFEEKLDSAQIL